jgi:hypothetical protein
MTPGGRRLAGTLGFGAALIVAALFAKRLLNTETYLGVIWIQLDRIAALGYAVLVLLAAMSFGTMLLRKLKLRPAGYLAAALFGTGLGLGAVSLVTLGLGMTGFLGRIRIVVALLVLLFLGLWDLGTLLRMIAPALKRARRAGAFRIALWAVLVLFLLFNITRAFEPPFDYDSLEYHLAAPAAYHEAGRVYFIRDNVYANFPQNVEMLYLAAFELTESRYRGAQLGQLLGALMGFLAALALREMVRGVSGKEAGDIAAAIFYVWPGVTVYSGMAYVELPLIFYATLALWALLWSWRRKLTRPKPRGWVLLSGIATGLALGVKYTAALFLFVPILIWLVVLGLRQRLALKEIARRGATYAAVTVICFSPWLVRNFANTRNPVYPLLYSVFDGSNWSAAQDARWTQAHSAKDVSPGCAAKQAIEFLFVNQFRVSLIALMCLPFAVMARRRERESAIWLALTALLMYGLWFRFTQQNLRFLEAGITVFIALAAIGAGRATAFGGGAARTAIILLLLFAPNRWTNYLNIERSLEVMLLNDTDRKTFLGEYFEKDAPDYRAGYSAMQFVNGLPGDTKVLFVGEAQMFYCEREHLAATVFNKQPLDEMFASALSVEEVTARMKERGVTHLYVDTAQLARLQRSYAYTYDGREYLGMLDGFDWSLFDRFIREGTDLVWSLPPEGVENFPWARWPEMLGWGDRTPNLIAIYQLK